MNDTDRWALFVLNFVTRGPARGEQITPLVWAIATEAAQWAHRRKLILDPKAATLAGVTDLTAAQLERNK